MSTKSKEKISKKLKLTFINWSQSVTYHCFPKIFKAHTPTFIKFIWCLVFVSFSSLTCFILVNIVLTYYQYRVVSTIQIIHEIPSIFPAITICDANPFTTQYAQKLIDFHAIQIFNKTLANMTYVEYNQIKEKLDMRVRAHVNDPAFGDENRRRLGFNLSHILYECVFSGISCDFNQDFRWLFNYNYGNCFQYNSNQNKNDLKRQIINGENYGLSLKLGPSANQNAYLVQTKGIKVFIDNQSHVPTYFETFVSVEPGKETSIAMSRVFSLNTPKPYSDCSSLEGKGFLKKEQSLKTRDISIKPHLKNAQAY